MTVRLVLNTVHLVMYTALSENIDTPVLSKRI